MKKSAKPPPKVARASLKFEASVIIITKNQKSLLQKSIPVLLDQNFKKKYEIIVVDSGSTDGAREYVESMPVRLIKIRPEIFNFARAFNIGAKKAKGKYLLRLSGDTIPIGENFLTEILEPFKNPKVGGVFGKYIVTGKEGYGYPAFWPGERFPKKITKYSSSPNPIKMIFSKNFRDDVGSFAGGCCVLRKKIWSKRPFNEKLIAAEDAEYAWFLRLIGYDIVYTPKAKVIHEHKINQFSQAPYFYMWFTKWHWQSLWQITKYYLKRLVFIDEYKNFKSIDF